MKKLKQTSKQKTKQAKDAEVDWNDDGSDLWDADPNCKHEVVSAPGGGAKCRKCKGWFCF